MLAVGSAEARELGFSIDGRVGGDSNVLRSGFRKVEDAFFEFSPRLSLRESRKELTYDLVYRPTFTTYAETDGIDGVDHVLRGSGTWSATPLDSLSFRVRYANRRQLRNDDIDPTSDLLLVPNDRRLIRRTTANVSYSRQLAPAWSGYVSLDLDDFDSSADDRGSQPDTRAYTGRLGANHALNAQTSAGLSVSGRFRDTRSQLSGIADLPPLLLPPNPSAKALIWDLSINLSRQISDTSSLSIQIGPSFISTELIPDIAQRPRDKITYSQDTSVFAAITFDQSWEKARFNASYVRSEFRGGVTASSTLSDAVDIDFQYDFTRKLSVRMIAGWNQRKQIVEIEDFGNIDTTQWRASATLTHRLTRQLSLIGQYAFRTQEVRGRRNSLGVGDTHTGFLSLRYTFDPIIF